MKKVHGHYSSDKMKVGHNASSRRPGTKWHSHNLLLVKPGSQGYYQNTSAYKAAGHITPNGLNATAKNITCFTIRYVLILVSLSFYITR